MSDKELYKAIKEYSDNNNLDNVREANKILRKIADTCMSFNSCRHCPYFTKKKVCVFQQNCPPVFWQKNPEKWQR